MGMQTIAGRAGENELSSEFIMATYITRASFLFMFWRHRLLQAPLTAGVCRRWTSPTKLPKGLTSSTLHAAPFPSAVRPDVQRILLLFWLASVFSSIVYRNGVFIMNSIILVMK